MKRNILYFILMAALLVSCPGFGASIKKTEAGYTPVAGPEENPFDAYHTRAVFTKKPSLASCSGGELSAGTKTNVLNFLNYIRGLHGLGAVEYGPEDDPSVQKGALLIAANGALSHNPPPSWKCWSKEGRDACGSSNIIGGTNAPFTPCEAVRIWLVDAGVESLGHRRWILSPFLKSVAYGHAEAGGRFGALLKVIGAGTQAASVDMVAYPFHEYPALLFDPESLLSFSVIQDRGNQWGNKSVDFSAASVTVTGENGGKLTVTSVQHDSQGFGVPNILAWRVRNLKTGTRYTVTVRNVKTKEGKKDYTYWFLFK